MNISRIVRFICFAFVLSAATPAGADDFTNAVQAFLQDHVDLDRKTVGIVVGIVDEHGSRVISYGKVKKGDDADVNGDTVFELGSITKVFTAQLLQDMVERGEMHLDDPVAKYLPASVKMPSRNGKEITLLHLATQTSGLPRDPDNFAPHRWSQPYADYTAEQLYAFLSGHNLSREPGVQYEYSNLGVDLLGHVLELKAGTNLESLIVERICNPLRMDSTRIRLTPELKARSATAHSWVGNPIDDLVFDGPLGGSGALHSTVADMLKYLSAHAGLTPTPLQSVIEKTHVVRFGDSQALGWATQGDFVFHNGGTLGSASFAGFDKKRRRGVVVLSNRGFDHKGTIGLALLDSEWEAASRPKAVTLDSRTFDSYIGQYQLRPDCVVGVFREGDRLLMQVSGQPSYELLPESETNFFVRVSGKPVIFPRDVRGDAKSLISEIEGTMSRLPKISDQPPKRPEPSKLPSVANIDSQIYETCYGKYKLASGRTLALSRQGDLFSATYHGSIGFELYPASESRFVCSYAPMEIALVKNNQGNVTGLTVSSDVFPKEFTGQAWKINHQVYDAYAGQYQVSRNFEVGIKRIQLIARSHPVLAGATIGIGLLILFCLLHNASLRKRQIIIGSAIFLTGLLLGSAALALSCMVELPAIDVRRDGDQLLVHRQGHPEIQLLPESETRFLAGVGGAPVTFVRNAQGHVTGLILSVNGISCTAARISSPPFPSTFDNAESKK